MELSLRRIKNDHDVWLEEVINFYHKQFTQVRDATSFFILEHVHEMLPEEANNALCIDPYLTKIRRVVFKLNGDSCSGPDGFTGKSIKYVEIK